MNAGMLEQAVEQRVQTVLEGLGQFLRQMITQAAGMTSAEAAADLERAFREGAMDHARQAFAAVLEVACNGGDAGRTCPHCGQARRHKGRRPRKLLTSLGAIAIDGICWQCESCGRHGHASQRLGLEGSTTIAMRELICLLGISSGSFAHAGMAMKKLLGVRLSTPTIASTCQEQGRVIQAAPQPADRLVQGTLVGSADGTMVHVRQEGWRELRVWRFDDDAGRRGSGAALEDAATFLPRLRQEALRHHADQVRRFIFVSDAAEWLRQGVAEHLPEAHRHVVDIFHAYQHIHAAARIIHGEGTEAARAWGQRWGDELYTRGAKPVWDRLRHARFPRAPQQAALSQLLTFLQRHADRMDYPACQKENIPISSGPMESTCKQLGRRLKGPGMRWRSDNVSPMAHLLSLWNDGRWDAYWTKSAA